MDPFDLKYKLRMPGGSQLYSARNYFYRCRIGTGSAVARETRLCLISPTLVVRAEPNHGPAEA